MDKYEYKLKLEKMKALTSEHDYKTAASIADSINWRKVRSVNSLCMVAEIYEHVDRMEDSRDMLLLAYDRSPIGKMIIYRLAMLAIKMNSLEEAEEYYQEFLEIAPHDNLKYVIRYRLHQAQDKDISLQIQDMEDLKEQEYTEEWAYELAALYSRAHMVEKCIETCDELVLWFGDGPYVEKALKLKMRYQPLSHEQAEKLRQLQQTEEVVEEPAQEVHTESAGEKQVLMQTEDAAEKEIQEYQKEEVQEDDLTARPMQVTAARSLHVPLPGIEEDGPVQIREVDDVRMHRESLKEGIEENFKQIMEAAKAEEQAKKEYDLSESAVSSVHPPKGAARPQAYDLLQGVLDEWEETRRQTAQTFREAEEKRLQAAKLQAIAEAEDTMDQLIGIIPESDISRLRQKLHDTEHMTADAAAKMVAEMTAMLQQEIDTLNQQQQEKQEELSAKIQTEQKETESVESEEASKILEDIDAVESKLKEVNTELEQTVNIDVDEREQEEEEDSEELEELLEEEYLGEPEDAFSEESEEGVEKEQRLELDEMIPPNSQMPSIQIPNMNLKIEVPQPILSSENLSSVEQKPELNPVEKKELQRAEEELQEELEAADMQAEEQELRRVEEELQEELEAADEELLLEPTQRMPDLSGILHKMRDSFQAVRDRVRQEDIYEPDAVEQQTEFAQELTPEEEISVSEKEDEEEQESISQENTDASEEEAQNPEESVDLTKEQKLLEEAASEEEEIQEDKTKEAQKVVDRQKDLESQVGEDVYAHELELEEEMVRLPREIRKIFSYFVPVTGMEQQLCRTLQGMLENRRNSVSSRMGNVLIQGIHGSGKTVLAADLIKAMQKLGGGDKCQVGKIDADILNQKDVAHILQKVSGGYLIIENAGKLEKQTAIKLSLLMEGDTNSLLVILEDTRAGIRKALSLDAGFAAKFTERVDIPYFTSDELVAFGRSYAKDLGYRIDEMGVLALYNRISSIQKRDQATTLTEVKGIVDDAIARSQKSGFKKILGMLSNRKEEEEYIPLKEKDFEIEE